MRMCEFDLKSRLWPDRNGPSWFRDLDIGHDMQFGGSCVATSLGLLTGEDPDIIREAINTQDPVSWSHYLQGYGMKLAYCPTDLRRLRHYAKELLALDDLFAISTYSSTDPADIGREPDSRGWICGSHLALLHRSRVHDTRLAAPVPLNEYADLDCYVKRVFRVVPVEVVRGL